MKTDLNIFESTSGWVGTGGVTADSIVTNPEFVADNRSGSLVMKFPAGAAGRKLTYTFSTPITINGQDQLVLSLWSRSKSGTQYQTKYDFQYIIQINGTRRFYLPVYPSFSDITVFLSGVTSIDRISIEAIHTDLDYLICSGLALVKDEYPLDIFSGLKKQIEIFRDAESPNGLATATITGKAGQKKAVINGDQYYIQKYCVITMNNGVNTETHQVRIFNECALEFTDMYDGERLKYDHSGSTAYVRFPVEFVMDQKEAIIPGVNIGGFAAEPVMRSSDIEDGRATFEEAGDVYNGKVEMTLKYPIYIDCVARQAGVLALISRIVRKTVGNFVIWINARKHTVGFSELPNYQEPDEGVEILPKLQYTIDVEVKEERSQKVALPVTSTIDVIVGIEE